MTGSSSTLQQHWWFRWRWRLVAVYLALLIVSHLINKFRHTDHIISQNESVVVVQAVRSDQLVAQAVRIAYREYRPDDNQAHPAVVLLHGSPGRKEDFYQLAPLLAQSYRVIVPDLPGFGHSTRDIPDYSSRAHAYYMLEMMDKLQVPRAHFAGFSMGGGVIINLADLAPNHVASLTMLSAIGVQEMELLGDYYLNHALHGLQLAGIWLLYAATPHFSWFDNLEIGLSYARNFYDSDQRPLREMLKRYAGPMLIVHGQGDVLVPIATALEHQRLVAQSELRLFDSNHFMVFNEAKMLADPINSFIDRVERGQAVIQANADPTRLVLSSQPFDYASIPKAMGIAAFILVLLIAAATLVSEDLTCIGAGVMAAHGRIDWGLAIFACFLGIFIGDILLFIAGRYLGRPAARRAPLRWVINADDVERSSAWFSHRGAIAIFASRFIPGMRLPTYFAAGLLNTNFWWFTLYFSLAAALWTPLLVGTSMILGAEVLKATLVVKQNLLIKALFAGGVIYFITKLFTRLATWRGRRMLLSSWRRLTRWEFWPPWLFYPPVVCYVAYLMLRHRSLTLFTAANPAILGGGFIGESKIDILRGLSEADGFVARAILIMASLDFEGRIRAAEDFMEEHELNFPIVLKPNQGQRGEGVAIIRSKAELSNYLRRSTVDTIIQEYMPGLEFGIFYYRLPEEDKGCIFSITEKRFPVVVGDNASTLEQLILNDKRAICMARFYLKKQRDRLWDVIDEGEKVELVELGTHCRGAIFLDGSWVKTAQLEEIFDQISRSFKGFYFGRFDVRTLSVDEFKQGRNFKILELNGVTSEATHIYDPKNSLFAAYKILFQQWRIAFDIGARNLKRGAKLTPISVLARLVIEYKRSSKSRPSTSS